MNIVLLHGLGRTRYSMVMLRHALERHGYTAHNFGYRSRHYSIEEHARRLFDFIDARELRKTELCFVTHSLGSIVLRRMVQLYGKDLYLRRAVMLGPPNQGSQLAALLRKSRLVSQVMGPAFLELSELSIPHAHAPLEVGVIAGGRGSSRGYSPLVSGDNDGIVSVLETRLEGARDHLVLRGLHSFLMYYPEVVRQTLHFLEHGGFKHAAVPGDIELG